MSGYQIMAFVYLYSLWCFEAQFVGLLHLKDSRYIGLKWKLIFNVWHMY